MAWPNSQQRRVALTIQASKVASTLTDFPVLLTEDCLPTEVLDSDDADAPQSDGGDIRFASDSSGNTQLAFDLVDLTQTSGGTGATAEIWVRVPSVSASVNTTIYMAWSTSGTTSAPGATDSNGRNNCWSEAELALVMEDATPIDRTGTHTMSITGTLGATTGPWGSACEFLVTDRLSNTDAALVDLPESYDMTISIVAKATINARANKATVAWDGTDDLLIYTHEDDGTPTDGCRVFWRDLSTTTFYDDNVVGNDWEWTHFTTRASNDHELYNDGVSGATSSATGTAGPFSTFFVGGWVSGTQPFDGEIAHLVVWAAAKATGWVSSEYNNQSDPATFVIDGTPEDVPAAGGSVGVGLIRSLKIERARLVA